jgi:hypothetical protein
VPPPAYSTSPSHPYPPLHHHYRSPPPPYANDPHFNPHHRFEYEEPEFLAHTVFVGEIPDYMLNEPELDRIFGRFGRLENIRIIGGKR